LIAVDDLRTENRRFLVLVTHEPVEINTSFEEEN
jgi:hypothetical protein